MVLRVVATEAVAQAAEGVSHKLQVAALWANKAAGMATWQGHLINHVPLRGLAEDTGEGFPTDLLFLMMEAEMVGKLFPP